MKCQAGGNTGSNQDCQEKYQQLQICRWHQPHGRKWREAKDPLDESERGEWKSWLKAQQSKNEESWHPVPSLLDKQMGKCGSSDRFPFVGLQSRRGPWLQPWNQKVLVPWKESPDKPRQHFKKQRHHYADKRPYRQSYSFSSSHAGLTNNYRIHWASLVVQTVMNLPAMQETRFNLWVGKIPQRRAWQPTPVFLPENPMDRGTWWATVPGVTKRGTWLSNWWTIKKAECRRIHAVCRRRFLRIPWTERRSNQSILKEINPEYLLEGLMLKLQYFGHLMWRADSLEKTLMLGNTEGNRRKGWQRMRWLDHITKSMDMSLSKFKKTVKDRGAWSAIVHGVRHDLATEQVPGIIIKQKQERVTTIVNSWHVGSF